MIQNWADVMNEEYAAVSQRFGRINIFKIVTAHLFKLSLYTVRLEGLLISVCVFCNSKCVVCSDSHTLFEIVLPRGPI